MRTIDILTASLWGGGFPLVLACSRQPSLAAGQYGLELFGFGFVLMFWGSFGFATAARHLWEVFFGNSGSRFASPRAAADLHMMICWLWVVAVMFAALALTAFIRGHQEECFLLGLGTLAFGGLSLIVGLAPAAPTVLPKETSK